MPKDLVVVGQRGMAIIDRDTPAHIRGFFTDNLQTCAGLYITDGEGKHAMLHVDRPVSGASMKQMIGEHFSKITDFVYVINPDYEEEYGESQMGEISLKICEAVDHLLQREIEAEELVYSKTGTLLVEIDRAIGEKTVGLDFPHPLLLERSIYDEDFATHRTDIHYVNIAESSDTKYLLDLQYDGKSYTRNG